MSDTGTGDHRENSGEFDRGFEGHRWRQVRLGLQLSPAQRLKWLEQTMEELRRLVGRARRGRPLSQEANRPSRSA